MSGGALKGVILLTRVRKTLSLLICIITLSLVSIPAQAEGTVAVRDITNYPDIEAPEHPHIWVYRFDDAGHWKECSICHILTTKTSHVVTGNSGTIDLFSLYWDTAYRDVCNCGWKGPAQRVVPGRPENYVNSDYFYDGYRWTKFSEVRTISSSVYYRDYITPSTKRAKGTVQGYSYSNGYVYGGGLVMANDAYGVIGTVGTIVGYDGYGNRSALTKMEECTRLVWFYQRYGAASRSTFLSTLPSCGSSHPLYGMYQKYASMSDYNFNRIMAACRGMSVHGIVWGCHGEHLSYQSCETPGTHWQAGQCTTSWGETMTMFGNSARNYTCAVCGTFAYGNEHLTYIDYNSSYSGTSTGAMCEPGTSFTSGPTTPTYYLSTSNKLGYYYYNFRRDSSNNSYRQLVVVPYSNASVTDSSGNRLSGSYGYYSGKTFISNWMYTPINTSSLHLSSYGWDTFAWFHDNRNGGQRQLGGFYYYAVQDAAKPVAYAQGNTSYWQLTGNGTPTHTSTQARIKVTFSDALYYPNNLVYARLLESDKTTYIPQDNGVEWKGLNNISGRTLWQGTLNIDTEVNGSKYVYVQTKDATGNMSALIPIQVSYIDAKGPTTSFGPVDISNGTWSRSKTVTVSGTDAFNNVNLGMSILEDDPAKMITVSNDEYNFQRTITFTGNVSSPKAIAIFGTDFSGNLSYKDIVIDKLDNTIPVVKYENYTCYNGYTNVLLSGTDKQQVFQNAQHTTADGSGVKYYGVSRSPDEEPTEWQTSPIIEITDTGTYYFWDKDNVDWVSKPTEGVYVPVQWKLDFDYDLPDIASHPMQGNAVKSKTVVVREKIVELPKPTITGWTLVSWDMWDSDETTRPDKLLTYDRQDKYELNTRTYGTNTIHVNEDTIYKWYENKTAQAEWRENRYTVRWLDQQGNEYSTGDTYLYDHYYEAPTQEQTGFDKPGYYIAYWSTRPDGFSHERFWSKDKDWPIGKYRVQQKFGNLTDIDDGVVDVYAIWKPIPYTIRIWDNYIGTKAPYKDYSVDYETQFYLPKALWEHGAAVCLGYDRIADVLVTPEWRNHTIVSALTTVRDSVVDIYTIWDNPPTISCPNEYHIKADTVIANGNVVNDSVVSRSQLEAFLLTLCEAKDWEYTKRYGTATVPIGQYLGYTVQIASIDPAKMIADAKGDASVYYVTYEVKDDAGNSATSTMTLYVSDKVNILVN